MVHGGMFFVLGFLSNWGFYRQRKRPFLSRHAAWFALLLCIVYGGIIEVLQGVVFTYRSADWFDWLFDFGGALLGLWFFSLFKNLYLLTHSNEHLQIFIPSVGRSEESRV